MSLTVGQIGTKPRGFWRRWWWIPALAALLAGSGLTAGYLTLKEADYSVEGKACRDFDVQPVEKLYGGRPRTVVDEQTKARAISCGFRILGGGQPTIEGIQPGVALVAILAETFDTPEQARAAFADHGSQGTRAVVGIGEHAKLQVMPVSSDSPGAMTHYLLYVLDNQLVLAVSMQALNGIAGVDQAAIEPALIEVARRAISTLD